MLTRTSIESCFWSKDFKKINVKLKNKIHWRRGNRIISPWSQTVHLSVQPFHQGDISRYGLDPKVFFGARVEGKAISHLLALRVWAVETVNLRTWGKIANKLSPKMAALWRPLWPTDGRWRRDASFTFPSLVWTGGSSWWACQGEHILSTQHLFLYQGLFNILDSHTVRPFCRLVALFVCRRADSPTAVSSERLNSARFPLRL